MQKIFGNSEQVHAHVCICGIFVHPTALINLHKCRCISMYALGTYCSPAFWPQNRSEGSVGSAGPWEEEVEEPQTLEQQHPQKQKEKQRDRERWWTESIWQNKKRTKDIIEERQSKSRMEEEMKKERDKKLVSERNSAGSIAEQLIYTFPISVLLCCVFQAGLKMHSSHVNLRIHLISICFKSKAKAVGSGSGTKHYTQTQKHNGGEETVQ